jgi:glutaredoxin
MRKLIVVALIAFGIWYWQKHNASNEVVLDESGNPTVLIYTAKQCIAPCQGALDVLNSRGVPYQKIELDLMDEQNENVIHWRSISDNMLPLTLAGHSKVKSSSKWELIGLLGDNFGDKYLTPDEKVYFARHFDASGAPRVVLYGTSWCPGCAQLRKDFREHGVDFVDIDVERSGEFQKLTQAMEIGGYPATWVGYTRVHGTTFNDIKAVMNKL